MIIDKKTAQKYEWDFKQLNLFVSHSDWIQKYLFRGAKNPDDLEANVSVRRRIRMSFAKYSHFQNAMQDYDPHINPAPS